MCVCLCIYTVYTEKPKLLSKCEMRNANCEYHKPFVVDVLMIKIIELCQPTHIIRILYFWLAYKIYQRHQILNTKLTHNGQRPIADETKEYMIKVNNQSTISWLKHLLIYFEFFFSFVSVSKWKEDDDNPLTGAMNVSGRVRWKCFCFFFFFCVR